MSDPRYINLYQLAEYLGVTQQRIYQREGDTLPRHIPGHVPREYDLAAVLWAVDKEEREKIARGMKLDPPALKRLMGKAVTGAYFPEPDRRDLLQGG